jgi:hypothetical protein
MLAKRHPRTRPRRYIARVTPDQELMLIFGALHLVAIMLGALLFWMFLRTDTSRDQRPSDEDEGGGGGNDRVRERPKSPPPGGLPLPDAQPSRARLRAPGRLADAHPGTPRRPAHPPLPDRDPHRRPARR